MQQRIEWLWHIGLADIKIVVRDLVFMLCCVLFKRLKAELVQMVRDMHRTYISNIVHSAKLIEAVDQAVYQPL